MPRVTAIVAKPRSNSAVIRIAKISDRERQQDQHHNRCNAIGPTAKIAGQNPSVPPRIIPKLMATNPMTSDVRAPYTVRAKTSRASWSVPNQWVKDGDTVDAFTADDVVLAWILQRKPWRKDAARQMTISHEMLSQKPNPSPRRADAVIASPAGRGTSRAMSTMTFTSTNTDVAIITTGKHNREVITNDCFNNRRSKPRYPEDVLDHESASDEGSGIDAEDRDERKK
jgi:hypothetical protein